MTTFIISKTIKRILFNLLYLNIIIWLNFKTNYVAQGYECFSGRFPVILEFNSGDTDIKFIDQDPLTGSIF